MGEVQMPARASVSRTLHGIGSNTVLDERLCRAAKSRGFSFYLRYVSRGEREQAGDLHEAEARTILNSGLALMPVQHVGGAGWSPKKALGSTYGRNAHVRQIEFPPGVNVWVDLVGCLSRFDRRPAFRDALRGTL